VIAFEGTKHSHNVLQPRKAETLRHRGIRFIRAITVGPQIVIGTGVVQWIKFEWRAN